jgi:uncharacterized protein YbjQ (UPF0145 family)
VGFFRRGEDEDAEQAESLARIADGGIPSGAEARLKALAAEGALFTSGLSVNEFALLDQLGPQPLAQVMGALRSRRRRADRLGDHHARRGGGDSLRTRAGPPAGADHDADGSGPVSEYDPDSLEGIPEAGRERLEQNREGLFTSDLSVNEFLLVTEAGFDPVGLVVGSSIFHIGFQVAGPTVSRELDVLSQAMYSARHLAMTRMEEEADQLGADGIGADP